MTGTHHFPSPPQPSAAAAQALADAAEGAACAWARPLLMARRQRAVTQLCSALRDLGIAARGLTARQVLVTPTGAVPQGLRPARDLPPPNAGAPASPEAASPVRHSCVPALSTAPGGAPDDHNQRSSTTQQGESR
jgi:hypothetical protein